MAGRFNIYSIVVTGSDVVLTSGKQNEILTN